jgi:hypothetical protein
LNSSPEASRMVMVRFRPSAPILNVLSFLRASCNLWYLAMILLSSSTFSSFYSRVRTGTGLITGAGAGACTSFFIFVTTSLTATFIQILFRFLCKFFTKHLSQYCIVFTFGSHSVGLNIAPE